MPGPIPIFFDLGDTLVVPKTDAAGALTALRPLPFVVDVLRQLLAGGTAASPRLLGVMSNTPAGMTTASMKALLERAGLHSFFTQSLLLYSSVEGHTKSEKAFFDLAASRAGVAPSRCIFVGEDAKERTIAVSAGFRVSFHPLHVFHVLEPIA
jgi:FMN phosphatase YigB (HAD superfamily)